MKELIFWVAGGILLFVMFIGITGAIVYSIEKYSCSRLSENIEKETKYRMWGGGCMVDVDGEWTPRRNWRVIE